MIAEADLDTLSQADLKRLAIDACRTRSDRSSWVQTTQKPALIAYIKGGPVPQAAGAVGAAASVSAMADMLAQLAQAAVAEAVGQVDLSDALRPIIINGAAPVKIAGIQHKSLKPALQRVAAGIPVLLVGPAGSGKTTLAGQVAKALGRKFTFNSMSAGVDESAILGRYIIGSDGATSFVRAPFAEAYASGGVHLFDEIFAADPNLLVTVNAALANSHLSIPQAGEVLPRHADFVCVAADNSWGYGSREYVGRAQADAATLDRFVLGRVFVDYDKDLERAIAEANLTSSNADSLLSWSWSVREKIATGGLRRIMSTRCIQQAAALMSAGMDLVEIKSSYVLGLSADEARKLGDC